MRALFIFMLCLLSPVVSLAQDKTDRDRAALKGPVETVRVRTTTTLDENGKQSAGPLLVTHVVTYDQSGNRTELALYDRFGTLSRRNVYTFDPDTKRRSGLITYDSENSMVRKVVDIDGSNGSKKTRTIHDFNGDGTLYRKTELAFDELGQLIEVAEYGPDGSLVKKDRSPFKEPELQYVVATQRSQPEDVDRVIGFGAQGAGEYFEPDSHGNWTRAIRVLSSRTYSSGKKIKTTETAYREFTYHQN
jgi:hypothetical protein